MPSKPSAAAEAFVNAILLTLSRGKPAGNSSGLSGSRTEANTMYGLDVSGSRTAVEKAARLPMAELKGVEQARQLKNPDAIVSLEVRENVSLMSDFACCHQGTSTGDNPRFVSMFWENRIPNSTREYFQNSPAETNLQSGKQHVIDWSGVMSFTSAAVRGEQAWTRRGVAIGQMRSMPATLFEGDYFSNSTPVVIPHNATDLPALWCYCSSAEFSKTLRMLNQKLSVDNGYVSKISIDIERWRTEARERFPKGVPYAHSNDPTQWIFHGHPCGPVIWDEAEKRTAHGPLRTDDTVLQIAVARLLGYRWPAEQDAQMELADEQREWVRRCETLLARADEDGIVCIPPIRGEPPAADRLLGLLAAAFGDAWDDDMLTKLLAEAGSPTLDDWLHDHFFDLHCKLFSPPPVRLAHLGRPTPRRIPRAGQLPQAGRGATAMADGSWNP